MRQRLRLRRVWSLTFDVQLGGCVSVRGPEAAYVSIVGQYEGGTPPSCPPIHYECATAFISTESSALAWVMIGLPNPADAPGAWPSEGSVFTIHRTWDAGCMLDCDGGCNGDGG